MSVTVSSRVFWTEFQDLQFQQGKKTVTVSKPVAKLVMLAIADNADDFGENSWQSFETIASKASIERRSVIRVVKALMNAGYLTIGGKSRYGTNDYKIDLTKLGRAPEARNRVGRPKTSDTSVTIFPKTSDSGAEIGDRGAKTSDPQSPYPSINHPKNNMGASARTAPEKQGDIMDGMLHFAAMASDPALQFEARVQEYPQDCQQALRWFVEVFDLLPSAIPAKPAKSGKGGDYALWINELREITALLEGFGKDAFVAAKKQCERLSISHPGAITWCLPAEVGKLSKRKTSTVIAPLNTPFAQAIESPVVKPREARTITTRYP